MNKKGLFVTISGGEGVGKTTLIDNLYNSDLLKGSCVKADMASTELGKYCKEYIFSHKEGMSVEVKTYLFLTALRDVYDNVIKPALNEGKVVLMDRWVQDTYAYQCLTEHSLVYANEIEGTQCPDLSILLDMYPGDALARIRNNNRETNYHDERSIDWHILIRNNLRKAFNEIEHNFGANNIINAGTDEQQVLTDALILIKYTLYRRRVSEHEDNYFDS